MVPRDVSANILGQARDADVPERAIVTRCSPAVGVKGMEPEEVVCGGGDVVRSNDLREADRLPLSGRGL
jgi:hypothetical protein